MTHRYYHPDLPASGGRVQFSEAEFQHAAKVMRVQVGDEIELFDGRGRQAAAVIREVTRRSLDCVAAPPKAVDREPVRQLDLGIALPKPDRARELVERLTELGVKSVTPLITSRTQRPPSGSLLERLRRGSIEACKQSGRNMLLQINDSASAGDFFQSCDQQASCWVADQRGLSIADVIDTASQRVIGAVGPAGGWTTEELKQARDSGFQAVAFGNRILRVETASVFMAARLLE